MSVRMSEKLDLVLFGVTGLVGRYSVKYLQKLTKEKHLTWGVGGRSKEKVTNVLRTLEQETGDKTITKIPIILADMEDEQSIFEMTSRTKILLNACGPLRAMGEVVVRSCIKTKTHYLDVSAEPNFLYKILVEHHQAAEKAGVYIVNACGFDCMVYDMGVLELQEKFPGTINSIETYIKWGTDDPTITGPSYNVSSWKSTIDLMINKQELKALEKRITPKELPELAPELISKILPFKPHVEDGWAIVLSGSDRPVMLRTQEYLYEEKKLRPIQIQTYYILKKLWHIIFFILFGTMFAVLVQFNYGRKLLMKYPYFFSCGLFGSEEPSEEMNQNAWFRLTMVARGWKGKLLKSDESPSGKPNFSMILQTKVNNPGYGASALCLVLGGIILATETSCVPKKYGVCTPGVVFGDTTMRELLNDNNLRLDVVDQLDL